MDIGEPGKIIHSEPLTEPAGIPEPAVPVREPEKVPA